MIKRQFRSITAAVCALALILPMVPVAKATENLPAEPTEEIVVETTAVVTTEPVPTDTTPADTAPANTIPEGAIPENTAPSETTPATEATPTEATDETGESELLAYLRNEVAAYISAYGLTPDMPDNVLAEVFFSLDGERAYAAWSKYDELLPLAMQMSAEEQETLLSEINTKLVLRFRAVMERAMSPALIAVAPVTVNNVTIAAPSASEITSGDGTITISASNDSSTACGNTTYTAKEVTITVTNAAAYAGTVSFTYTTDGSMSVASPYTSEVLAAGKSTAITFTTNASKNGDATILTLSDLAVTEDNTTYSVTVEYDAGSVTVDGAAVENSGAPVSVPSTGSEFVSSDANFLAWIDASNNKILSTDATLTPEEFKPTGNAVIRAVSKTGTTAWFRAGGSYLYSDLNAASDYAATVSDKTVVLMNDGTLAAGNYTIDSGVTLLIPYDAANTLCTTAPTFDGSSGFLSASANSWGKPTAYRTLTLAAGANIIVNGAMSLSGMQCGQQTKNGSPTKATSFVKMETGSTITVNSGANLYVWGYITGSGSVTVKSGGTVYEDFQVTDWRGGTAASGMIDKEQKVFPVSQYYVQNVEVPMTLETGAAEKGFMSIVASKTLGQTTIPFIGSDGMFRIGSGSIIKDYIESEDRLKITINGTLTMSSLNISVSSYSMNSANYVLPVTNNLDVHIKSGTTTISQDMAILPGAEITVYSGAELELASGVNMFVYDLAEWDKKSFVYSAKDYSPVPYANNDSRASRSLSDAVITVNGTFDASAGNLYTTTGGASITSDGGGTLITKAAASGTVTYQATQSDTTITFVEIPITSAKLQNADGNYVETANLTAATTYNYCANHGLWYTGECSECATACSHANTETIPAVAPTCTKTGLTEGTKCSDCGEVIVAQEEVPATGHTEETIPAVAPTCTTAGKTEGTKCSACGTVIKAQEDVPATGHSYETKVTAPTCTAEGYTTYTCSTCGDTYTGDNVAATGHSYTSEVTTAASCTAAGVETFTCGNCGDTYTEDINATGHTEETIPGKDATCTEAGLTDGVKCSVCKEVLVAQTEVAAPGHKYNAVVTDPTCENAGYTTYTCSACGDSYVDNEVAALGHKYEAVVTAPTCENAGYTTYTCSACGDSYVDNEVAALGHKYEAVVTAPTCESAGYTTYTCSACGHSYTADEVAATGHKYTDVMYSWEEDGSDCTATRGCSKCDLSETAVAEISSKVTTDATCVTMGKTTYTATFAEAWATEQTKVLEDLEKDADNHASTTLTYTDNEDGTHTVTYDCCKVKKATENHKYGKDYLCVCKAHQTFTVTWVNGDEHTETTVKGGETITLPAAPVLEGHNFAGWFNGEEPVTAETVCTGNVTYTAKFQINQYTITFDTAGGNTIAAIKQDYGTAVTAPADPTKEGYTFAGWDTKVPATMPAGDMTITAKWTINQYTITFNTDGGSAIAAIKQDYGTTVKAPADPTKTGYTFAGWDKDIPDTMPAENVTITAQWTINTYTVTWVADGETVKTETVEHGQNATAPEVPAKVGHTGSWDKDGKNITADTTISAVYTALEYTVTWVNEGTTFYTAKVAYGETIQVPTDTPHKDRSGCTVYSFANWVGLPADMTMSAGDLTVTAAYTEAIEHTNTKVTYQNPTEMTHDEYYACCNTLKAEKVAHTYGSNGECVCGQAAAAMVTISGQDAYYSTLNEAVTAMSGCTAEDNAILKLMRDYIIGETAEEKISIETGVFTFDINGKNLTCGQLLKISNEGTVVTFMDSLSSGSVHSKNYTIGVHSGATVNIINGKFSSDQYSVVSVSGEEKYRSILNIEGGTITGGSAGVTVRSWADLNISSGTICGGYNGIVAEGASANTNITGGTISGTTFGIQSRFGTLNISGGEITNTAYGESYSAAIYVGSSTVNVTGGTFAGIPCTFHHLDYPDKGRVILDVNENGEGATFRGGISILGDSNTGTVNKYLSDGVRYWANDKMLTIADAATEITDMGDITVKTACGHTTLTHSPNEDGTTHTTSCPCGWSETAPHAWNDGEVITDPTCEATGVKTFTCGTCGDTYTEEVAALGHNEISHEAQAPTCTEIGWDAYVTCSRCDYTTYVEKEALGHTNLTYTDLKDGKHKVTCSCGEVVTASEPHTYDPKTHMCMCEAVELFTVTFTVNGEAYGEPISVAYGAAVTAPEYVTPEGHTFSGWDVPETMPAEDITLDATLTVNKYTIRFINADGSELQSSKVTHGEMPKYTGETPTKAADAEYTYTFAGWDPEIVATTADADYTATFTAEPIKVYVAQVGETQYETLAAAIEAAGENGVVTLLANITEAVTVNKAVTITKNGFTAVIVAGEGFEVTESNESYVLSVESERPVGTIIDTGRTLSLDGVIYINQYFKVEGFEGLTNQYIAENGGMLIWSEAISEENAVFGYRNPDVNEGLSYDSTEFMARTDGVVVKMYADELYLRVYVRLEDGTYVYGPLVEYSVQDYCEGRLEKSSNAKLKNTCAAMLHYGAAAQTYFGYNTSDLANANILESWPASEFSSAMLDLPEVANTTIVQSESVKNNGRTLSYDGAILINYYFGTTVDVSSADMLVWEGVSGTLTPENATSITELTYGGVEYHAQSREFAAKEYGTTIYVCARFIDVDGNVHYSDVTGFSPEAYAEGRIKNSSNAKLVNLVKQMVIYGEYAKIYFAK